MYKFFKYFSWLILLDTTNVFHVRAFISKNVHDIPNVSKVQFYRDFPFVVSIASTDEGYGNEYLHQCTGSLISNRLVLTAAHCLHNSETGDLKVLVGSNVLSSYMQTYAIESWIVYCTWFMMKYYQDCKPKKNDIAIIQLIKAVNYPPIKPATLAYTSKYHLFNRNTHPVFSVGWGSTMSVYPTIELKIAILRVISDDACQERLQRFNLLADIPLQFFCSIGILDWILLADGDSGGPVMNSDFAIIGINKAIVPNDFRRNLSAEFVHKYQSNVHMSIYEYQEFIEEIKLQSVLGFFNSHQVI